MNRVRAGVVGIAGPGLGSDEARLLARLPPAGVIIFARNCADREQLARLVRDLRATQDGRHLPVLIDQEGGRVMRLKPPHWRRLPPAAAVGALPEAPAAEAAWLLGRLIAHDLAEVGIDIDCAPVIDLAREETTRAIGDRSFGSDPETVASLAGRFAAGLAAGGVAPVIKHLPGHGRARLDSHHDLPVVEADADELAVTDLVPARRLAHLPFAMTAHVLYPRIDPDCPATLSAPVIDGLIRRRAGFAGILLSDDLAMRALSGAPAERARAALAAGCDLALTCTGELDESRAVLEAVPAVAPSLLAKLDAALPPPSPEPFAADAAEARLWSLLEPGVA